VKKTPKGNAMFFCEKEKGGGTMTKAESAKRLGGHWMESWGGKSPKQKRDKEGYTVCGVAGGEWKGARGRRGN